MCLHYDCIVQKTIIKKETNTFSDMNNDNVKYVDLSTVQDFPEDVVLAKMDIESLNESPERNNMVEFIGTLDMNSIYVNAGNMMSFSVRKGRDNIYVFYMNLQNPYPNQAITKEENLENFKVAMQKIDNDMTKLRKRTTDQLLEGDLNYVQRGEFFIIGNEFYII